MPFICDSAFKWAWPTSSRELELIKRASIENIEHFRVERPSRWTINPMFILGGEQLHSITKNNFFIETTVLSARGTVRTQQIETSKYLFHCASVEWAALHHRARTIWHLHGGKGLCFIHWLSGYWNFGFPRSEKSNRSNQQQLRSTPRIDSEEERLDFECQLCPQWEGQKEQESKEVHVCPVQQGLELD